MRKRLRMILLGLLLCCVVYVSLRNEVYDATGYRVVPKTAQYHARGEIYNTIVINKSGSSGESRKSDYQGVSKVLSDGSVESLNVSIESRESDVSMKQLFQKIEGVLIDGPLNSTNDTPMKQLQRSMNGPVIHGQQMQDTNIMHQSIGQINHYLHRKPQQQNMVDIHLEQSTIKVGLESGYSGLPQKYSKAVPRGHYGALDRSIKAVARGHYGTSDRSIDCHKLASGDKAEMKQAEEFAREYKYKPLLPSDYLSLTANCTSFRLKRGYSPIRTDDEEKAFPLAFTIRMHESVEQAERLLRAIYRPHNVYCIHIDRKSPSSVHTAMAAVVSCLPNVHLASHFIDYGYGTYSPVETDLICMKDLIQSPVQWKYLLNMAGTEFPLKTNKEIVTILKYLNGSNDVEQLPFFPQIQERYKYKWERYGDYIRKTNITKSPFPGITLLKGCSYNSLSRAFVEWVLSDDEVVVGFLQWLQDTAAPDETVWASLNNHPHAPGGYPVMVTQTSKTFLSREVIWQWGSAYCQSKLRHQICLLSFHELPWLNQRWELFANKFDLTVDHVGYGCLEQLLQERTRLGQVQIPWYGIDRATHVYFTRVLHKNVTQAAKERLLAT